MTAEQIINHANDTNDPNAGIRALVRKDWCVMDEDECNAFPYKCEGGCLDYYRCKQPGYMLACVQSRLPSQLAQWAIEAYSEAMEDK